MNNREDDEFLEAVATRNFEAVENLFFLASRDSQRLYMNTDDFTPLHRANSAGVVQYCISSGINVDSRNPETDETPLLTAVKLRKSPNVVKELLKHGAAVEARNKLTLNTPLNQAMQFAECITETVQALLDYGADANTVNKCGIIPLHAACKNYNGDLTIIELLLKKGALVNRTDSEGCTPLTVALKNDLCSTELLNLLLKFNAKVSLENLVGAISKYGSSMRCDIAPLIEHACFTRADDWRSVLEGVCGFFHGDQLRKFGMLVIQHSFLWCGNPHDTLVDFLLQKDSLYVIANKIDKLISFADNCFQEIERMKADKLENNASIYKMISTKKTMVFPDGKILERLKKNYYPIYSDILLNKTKRSFLIDKLTWQKVYAVGQRGDIAHKIVLDNFSVSCIAVFLDEDDIKNFADAFRNPSKRITYFSDKLLKIEAVLSKKKANKIAKSYVVSKTNLGRERIRTRNETLRRRRREEFLEHFFV